MKNKFLCVNNQVRLKRTRINQISTKQRVILFIKKKINISIISNQEKKKSIIKDRVVKISIVERTVRKKVIKNTKMIDIIEMNISRITEIGAEVAIIRTDIKNRIIKF